MTAYLWREPLEQAVWNRWRLNKRKTPAVIVREGRDGEREREREKERKREREREVIIFS